MKDRAPCVLIYETDGFTYKDLAIQKAPFDNFFVLKLKNSAYESFVDIE